MLKLVQPSEQYANDIFAYKAESLDIGEPHINGGGGIENYDSFKEWKDHIDSYRDKEIIPAHLNRVEGSQWLLVDDITKRVLGMINLRHYLNEFLLNEGGHIGYSIRPNERRKGYGKLQLQLALTIMEEKGIHRVLVTCDDTNLASAKTIESCGGILENIIVAQSDHHLLRRYWITIK